MPPEVSAPGRNMRDILVVGGGVVGWSAAAALRRRMPWLAVTIVPQPTPGTAIADTMSSTLPSIMGFHGDLGLSDEDTVRRTGAQYRLGSLFSGWAGKRPDYLHAYGPHGHPFGATSFHLHWARLAVRDKVVPFDHHAPAVALARAGRLPSPTAVPDALFGEVERGLQLDLPRYLAMMRAFALHCGVREQPGTMRGAVLRDDGAIAAVTLDDGSSIAADLYIDATGPSAKLRGAIDDRREDWSSLLPCDRVIWVDQDVTATPALYDTVTAAPAGWRWHAATTTRQRHGICYASAFCDDGTAARQLRVASGTEPRENPISIAAGARPAPWRHNCVAVGDAATVIEPLEWSNLHLAHSAIDRIVAMMPAVDCAPVELAEYNRQAFAEATRVRDFVMLHYVTASRTEPFWRAASATPLPATLAHTLALFRERGRLPFHEEETFARDSWLAVLFGQGVLPRRIDPLAEAVPAAEAASAMAALRGAIDAVLPTLPTQADYLAAQTRQSAR
jgi:tryptophan halogenase